jgi:hypothetical protein
MLIKDFNVYLPELDEFGYPVEKGQEDGEMPDL